MPSVDLRSRSRTPRLLAAAVAFVAAAAAILWWRAGMPEPWAAHAESPVLPVLAPPELPTAPSREPRTEPLAWWLGEIAARAGLSLVIDPRLDAELTASPIGEDWRRALDALSRAADFDYEIADGFLEVRIPEVSEPEVGEPASSPSYPPPAELLSQPASTLAPPPTTTILPIRSGRARELAELLADTARVLEVVVEADPVPGALVITGLQAAVDQAAAVARQLDVARRVFRLEVEIVEISSTVRSELGIQWAYEGRLGGEVEFAAAQGEGGAALLATTLDGRALRARLAALASDGSVRVVSRPSVSVLEGSPATIESVRVLRVRLPDRASLVDGDEGLSVVGNSGRAVEEIPVGVTLEVSPSLLAPGRVLLAIKAESSTLGPPQPPDGIPEEFSRLVEAELVMADGETVVLGGLLREGASRSASGVPVLRAIPVLGALFGRREKAEESEELIFLVTPTEIRL